MPRPRGDSVDIARDKIMKRIESFEVIAGDVISDLELSKELDMSRTPIREAIQQLIHNGLLERTDTKVVVKAITKNDIEEIIQLREAIETVSVRVVILNGGLSQQQAKLLKSTHEQFKDNIINGRHEENFFNDSIFHQKIIEFSNNKRFYTICNQLNLQSRRLRWLTVLTPSRYNDACVEHERIAEALLDRDLLAAKEAIRDHLEQSRNNYLQILQSNQWNKIMLALKNVNGF